MNSYIIDKQSPSTAIEPNKIIHVCSQCTRTFKDINNFREHLFQEHGELGVNVRQCHLCSYATLLKSKYDCHIRCHLNNRVLRCQKCNYSTINIRSEPSCNARLSHSISSHRLFSSGIFDHVNVLRRHMSKHERQHSMSNSTAIPSEENPLQETKRARYEHLNPSPPANWSTTLYINTQIKEDAVKANDLQSTRFSSCFLTDKLLMPDNKKALFPHVDRTDDAQNLRSLQSNSSYSTEESSCIPCAHQSHLVALRTNVWTLLRMLLPQLSFYYPSVPMIDYESDPCIDRLVANLIQIPSFYGSYPPV